MAELEGDEDTTWPARKLVKGRRVARSFARSELGGQMAFLACLCSVACMADYHDRGVKGSGCGVGGKYDF